MIKTIEEIKEQYEKELSTKEDLNALSLPTGKNNMYTLVYISFFEDRNLTLLQKGILIHLYIRGGHIRVVKHSKNKIAKTIGLSIGAISNNIKKLENLKYLKTFKKLECGNKAVQADLIYLYPINDITGLPITSSEEEIKHNIDYMIKLINDESNRLFKVEEKFTELDEVITDLNMDLNFQNSLIEKLDRNINTSAHLSFMENPLLTINDKVIYLYLKLRSGQYNVFFEEKKKIAANLNISLGTLNNSLNKLSELNYIVKFKRFHSTSGQKSSDILYINYYDNFTGLPDINDSLMKYNIDIVKKINLSGYNLVREKNSFSKKDMNLLFTKQIKDLLELDNEISDVYYDTFIDDIIFELNNDVIKMIVPRHLNSFKTDLVNKLEHIILKYAKAILKTNTDLYLTVESHNVNSSL